MIEPRYRRDFGGFFWKKRPLRQWKIPLVPGYRRFVQDCPSPFRGRKNRRALRENRTGYGVEILIHCRDGRAFRRCLGIFGQALRARCRQVSRDYRDRLQTFPLRRSSKMENVAHAPESRREVQRLFKRRTLSARVPRNRRGGTSRRRCRGNRGCLPGRAGFQCRLRLSQIPLRRLKGVTQRGRPFLFFRFVRIGGKMVPPAFGRKRGERISKRRQPGQCGTHSHDVDRFHRLALRRAALSLRTPGQVVRLRSNRPERRNPHSEFSGIGFGRREYRRKIPASGHGRHLFGND